MKDRMMFGRFSVLRFVFLIFVMLLPATAVWALEPENTLTVIKPQNGVYTYTNDATSGADYVIYVLDGIDSADNVLNWDTLTGKLKYVDQKTAEGTSVTFEIPQTAITGNGTFYIGDGAGNESYLAGYLTEDTEVGGEEDQSFFYSDVNLTTALRTEYKCSSDRSNAQIRSFLPESAYLKLQTKAPDDYGLGGTYLAVPVHLTWEAPAGVDGFHTATDSEIFFHANVTFGTDSAAGKAGAAWAATFPVPELQAKIKGPDQPDPKPQQYHRIYVQNNAEAFLYSSQTLDYSANSAKSGEDIIIRWKRNCYDGNESEDGYEFVKWIITGAEPWEETSPQTMFTMGNTDVTVQFLERKVLYQGQESGEEEPEDRDKDTKLSKLKYVKTSLTLVKGSSDFNPALATPAKGVSAENLPPVTYITENKDIVTTGSDGTFYAKGAGEAVVTAYCGNKKATCKVTVISPTEKVVILDENGRSRPDVSDENEMFHTNWTNWNKKPEKTIILKSGEDLNLRAQIYPCDSTDPKNVTWNVYAWPIPKQDRYGNWIYDRDKNGNIKFKKDNRFVTVKNGVLTAKEAIEPNYNPILVAATVKQTVIDPVTGKTKSVDLTSMVPVYVHPIVADKPSNKEDKTHTLSLKKQSVSMVTTEGNNTFDLELTVSSKQKADAVDENYIIECESLNANVAGVENLTDLVNTDTKGKKGAATIRIKANNPGYTYIIVKSRNKGQLYANIQRCKVTVTRPATAVTAVSGTLKIGSGPIKVYNRKTRQYDDSEDVKILTMRKGSCGTIEAMITPYDSTDLKNVKISASGGVKIKNGVLYATSLTKPEKGSYAKVTITCGKLKDIVYITVVK
ncbi:MAG: hypothetical protein J5518_05790 [Lachnospiraceae bacterium]|nr:hypothetical protein [Lachnospiraceae bacterium]